MTSPADVEAAVNVLKDGGVIAIPTDTLYALSANARNAEAVRRVYAIKVREQGKPLPLFVSGIAMAESFGVLNDAARALMSRFWPGALTVVIEKQPGFDSDALAGGSTVALRQPDNAVALAVLEGLGHPLTATSANRSGDADPVSADEVRRQLDGAIDLVIDTGPCAVGMSSTIVDCSGPELRILRQGAIPAEEIEAVVAASRV
ncbi:MAG: L-threonylcarbamoyladenylate synthase [Dehalococcoidia bacterium]